LALTSVSSGIGCLTIRPCPSLLPYDNKDWFTLRAYRVKPLTQLLAALSQLTIGAGFFSALNDSIN
jgi:hypothetical protein